MQGLYDYGPLGVELKTISKPRGGGPLYERDDMEGLDSSISRIARS